LFKNLFLLTGTNDDSKSIEEIKTGINNCIEKERKQIILLGSLAIVGSSMTTLAPLRNLEVVSGKNATIIGDLSYSIVIIGILTRGCF
jgi:hypothetical protein